MEDDTWSIGFSTASRSYQSTFKTLSDLCIDLEEEIEGDDESKTEYPCPFCTEDFDLVGLCCHIDEEHPIEAKSGVCPVCGTSVGMNIVGHTTTQHRNIIKNWQKLKLHKSESYSNPFSRKEFQDGRFQTLPTGSSPVVSTSKMAPDPLLSFLYNVPADDKSESMQPDSSSEVSLEDENSEETILDRTSQLIPLSDKDQIEKAGRCEFVQGLFLSTILDDGL
ncbi:protein DEHYDRATION-INDUCED 19 homolog 3 isoform X1 [Quercus suber]|uniref:protein DEHYDRATION-INDUCED 19 homolog 3 isoform X1 n=1 Tax=Quercus suber TaxID=58331 RepID=UPI000CE1BF98|nr:protein DEHYDRATION-INDUCED 19 homolog 3-like isoform X1 [Quercus suber]